MVLCTEFVMLTDFFPPLPLLGFFLAASLLLAVTPGPAVLYIVTRSLSQGRAAGLASVAGVALGNLGNALGAALGLAALFAASSAAFHIVKYAGAAYLVYPGVQAWRRLPTPMQDSAPKAAPLRTIFRSGFWVALLNPKTMLFFAAFLPQFLTLPEAAVTQTLILGTLFVLLAAITDSAYALAAGSVRPWLLKRAGFGRMGQRLVGSAYIGMGLMTAFAGQRPKG